MTPPDESWSSTDDWCRRAEEVLRGSVPAWRGLLNLVREGIVLRRRWDRTDREAAARRAILRLLPAVQTICQEQIALQLAQDAAGGIELTESTLRHLAEDGAYLGLLVGEAAVSPEAAALAAECFRDDIHWLGALAAVAEGHPGPDFLGRILLEQEALQHQMEAWDGHATARPVGLRGSAADLSATGPLRAAANRLRATAIVRQADALLDQPSPWDWRGWFDAWQAASRLASRLTARSPGDAAAPTAEAAAEIIPQETCAAVEGYRARAARQWAQSMASLPEAEAAGALSRTAGELVDTAAESLTFLEDLPLPAAVRTLEVLCEDTETCLEPIGGNRAVQLVEPRRALRRQHARARGELQDRRLTWRMECLLGRRAVAALERLIFAFLLLFIVLLVVESPLIEYERRYWFAGSDNAPSVVEAVFAWLDLAICLVFLGEFSLKLALAQGKWLYFRRNWITGLLPSIPFGFLAFATHQMVFLVEEGEWFVLLRFLRYLRLPQMARWLRVARPALRAVRRVGFVIWASDRLVKQLSPLLNRNLVLFERATIEEVESPRRTALAALRERFSHRLAEMLAGLSGRGRAEFVRARIDDLAAMLSSPPVPRRLPPAPAGDIDSRELRLEEAIAHLQSATPAAVSEHIGRNLAQSMARWCRAFDLFGLRRLPLIRDLVAAGRLPGPYETAAHLANRAGQILQGILDRVYWFADLHGTVTAPQLVDSIGDWMVRGTARPARRFLLFGGLFLVLSYVASLLPNATLQTLTGLMDRVVGTPLIVLGTLCLLPLLIGLWFRQIAGEATDYCSRVAEAQFLTATKDLKRRLAARHRALVDRRVAVPGAAESVGATVELLWQDYLEGAPFHRSDTRTTTQLLGNVALLSLRQARLRYGRQRLKRLRRLDLAHTRGSIRGPYLWFHCVARSLAQQTARLLVDYDSFAIPLSRAETADDGKIRRYLAWLARRLRRPVEECDLPPAFRARAARLGPEPAAAVQKRGRRPEAFQASDFTSIHFLSNDSSLEADIRRRYGDQVADLMRRDRRDNVRRVFRTYPLHRLPKERRTFNPLTFYQRHLAGGWVLVFPFKVAWWLARLAWRSGRALAAGVREVLRHRVGDAAAVGPPDPYAVAVRKIHRMRKPVFMECLEMRAEFDPEYLGVTLSDDCESTADAPPTVEEDLSLVNASASVRRRFGRLAAERRRQVAEFRSWCSGLGLASCRGEALRAAAIAYTIDYHGSRSRLEAVRALQRALAEVDTESSPKVEKNRRIGWAGWLPWTRARVNGCLDRLFQQPAFDSLVPERRSDFRDLLLRRPRLRQLAEQVAGKNAPEDPIGDARQVLAGVARDPATWTQQLVVLRTVQTLSVLDLMSYCELVAELGEYGPCASGGQEGILGSSPG
jgi:hypothetical protein